MVDRSAPQPLPRAKPAYELRDEQEMRDIVGRSLDDARRRVIALQAEIDALEAMLDTSAFGDYVDDAAADAGGVEIGEFYRNGSQVMVRVA